MRLDPLIVQQQISNLLLQVPELAEDEVLRADMVEGSTEAHELLRQLEARRREAITLAAGIAVTLIDLKQRLDRMDRREAAMRRLIFKIMELANLHAVELPEATLSVRIGQRKIIITDEAIIPDILCRIKREPDKKRLKEMLLKGQVVRGCELSNTEQTLSIRTK